MRTRSESSLVITHRNHTGNWLCHHDPAAASREFPGLKLFCSMTHQAIRHGPELELNSWRCLEHVLHNWCSVELPSLPSLGMESFPLSQRGVGQSLENGKRLRLIKPKVIVCSTPPQLSKEAAATPEGHPTGCHPTHRSAARVTGWRQLRFHDIGTNWDMWKVCTPMFCCFPGLKQLQLKTSFFPSSEKHLLLVTKGLGMAYCVIAQMTENKFKYKKYAGLFFACCKYS